MTLNLSLHPTGLSFTDAQGILHQHLRPVRLFPLTDSQHWIALVNEQGREVACIEDPLTLGEEQRTVLNAALARRDFVPVIRRIANITRAPEGHDWHVETDRGPTTFRIETDESIQPLGTGRLVIIDKLGTRYLVPNIQDLDRDSRRRLERYY